MNLNDGVIRDGAIESLGARIALPRDMRREPAEGTRVRWGVRPEYVRWSDDGADMPAFTLFKSAETISSFTVGLRFNSVLVTNTKKGNIS